jgi:hypothetical protein
MIIQDNSNTSNTECLSKRFLTISSFDCVTNLTHFKRASTSIELLKVSYNVFLDSNPKTHYTHNLSKNSISKEW